MDNPEIILLRKFIHNYCTPQELVLVDHLIKKGVDDDVWIRLMNEAETAHQPSMLPQGHRNRLYKAIELKTMAIPVKRPVFINNRLLFSGIAAYVLLFLITVFVLYITNEGQVPDNLLTILTKGHERQQLKTTDGSHIWINSHSAVRYPQQFASDLRRIELEGEAFFQIARDPERPFVITTQNLTVTVLGTSFNVKSYREDDEIIITIATGKVQVEAGGQHRDLLPGEQLHFNKESGIITTVSIDPEEAYSWKDGWLTFNSVSLADISKTLERWYGVKVIIEGEALKKMKVTLKRKDETLNNVLEIISFTAGVNYEIANKIVTIKPKK